MPVLGSKLHAGEGDTGKAKRVYFVYSAGKRFPDKQDATGSGKQGAASLHDMKFSGTEVLIREGSAGPAEKTAIPFRICFPGAS